MLRFLRNRHFLINMVIKLITKIHPVISDNIAKINFKGLLLNLNRRRLY